MSDSGAMSGMPRFCLMTWTPAPDALGQALVGDVELLALGRADGGRRVVGSRGLREPRPEVRQLGPLADRQPRERAADQALSDERPAAVSLDPVPGHERLVQQLAAHRLDRVAPELGDTPDLHGRKCMLRALSRAPGRPASRRRGNHLRDGRPTRGGESTLSRAVALGSASPSAHPVGRTHRSTSRMHDPRHRVTANLRSLLARAGAVALLALALPAAAHADGSGGASPSDTPSVPVTPVPAGGPLLPAPVDLGGRIGAMVGMPVTLSGNFPGGAGRAVAVQRQDAKRGWVTVASATAAGRRELHRGVDPRPRRAVRDARGPRRAGRRPGQRAPRRRSSR